MLYFMKIKNVYFSKDTVKKRLATLGKKKKIVKCI